MYKVELLDSSLTPITQVKAFVPLNQSNNYLEYSKKLSDYGEAKFRIATTDPIWDKFGDIVQPYANHVRITRYSTIVWQGVIVNNPKRTSNYIEVQAYTYLYLFSKVLIRHDAADGRGGENYRTLQSGTMATAVQTLITEGKADAGNLLSRVKIGTIENPVFPAGYVDFQGTNIAGQAWTFSSNFNIKYDWRSLLYVIQSLGIYAVSDFELVGSTTTNDLTFNFRKFLGTRRPEVMFEYSAQYGSIEDYNLPRSGERMANKIVGVAADNQFNILKIEQSDPVSIAKYGPLADVAAYVDVKSKNLLQTRVGEELAQVATPESEANIILNDRAYPLGVYDIGDIVTIKIIDRIISFQQERRVVGIDVKAHLTGKETIRLVTNRPRSAQV